MILPAAYQLLPEQMCSREADALLLSIGQQESRFQYRRQIQGPARGYWQFEARGGVWGVMNHRATTDTVAGILNTMDYPHDVEVVHEALADNDILAACFARLLLWTDPRAFPKLSHPAEAWWNYYIRNWRPGKPKRHTFDEFWTQALEVTA